MRFLSFSVVMSAASCALVLACSSSHADPSAEVIGPGIDGGPGNNDGSAADGGQDGAPIEDSGEPDVQTVPGPVKVTVSNGQDGPVEGAVVVIRDTDGSEETFTTDSNGDATRQLVHAGATVTVGTTRGGARDLTTIAKIEPSEEIFVGTTLQSFVAIPFTVNVTAFGGAADYLLDWGCGNRLFPKAGVEATGYITSKCLDSGGSLHVLITARDDNDTPLAYAFKTLTPGGGDIAISVGGGDWNAVGAASNLTVSNVPVGATPFGEIAFVNGESLFGLDDAAIPLAFIRPPVGFTPSLIRGSELSSGYSLSSRFELQALGTGDLAEDAATYLPMLTAPQVTGTASAPSLSWTAAGSLAGVTGFIAELESSKDENEATVPLHWTIVFPGQGATTFAPPALPAALAAYVPTQPWIVTKITAIDSAQFGYRQLHRDAVSYQTGVRNRDLAKLGTAPFAVRYTLAYPLPPP